MKIEMVDQKFDWRDPVIEVELTVKGKCHCGADLSVEPSMRIESDYYDGNEVFIDAECSACKRLYEWRVSS